MPSSELTSCPNCGALNDRAFRRCVRCQSSLEAPPSGRASRGAGLFDGRQLWGSKALLALSFLVFTGQAMAALGRGGGFPILRGGTPAESLRFGALLVSGSLLAAEPWRLLSAVFVHFGALHLLMNALAHVQLSKSVEPALGTARYVLGYVTCGIAGFAATAGYALLLDSELSFTAGASGSIFGTMGMILGVLLRRRDPRWKGFAVQAVLFSLMLGFGMNASGSGVLVNTTAHVGGLVWGILLGLLWGRPSMRAEAVQGSGLLKTLGGLALLASIASLALAQASPLWREMEQLQRGADQAGETAAED